MKKIYATVILTSLLITLGWLAAFATSLSEQTALQELQTNLSDLPADWIYNNEANACNFGAEWTGLICNTTDLTIEGIDLAGLGVVGNIPLSFTAASLANVTFLDLTNNGLYTTSGNPVDIFITGLQSTWKDTQVVPPLSVSAQATGFDSILVQWVPNTDYGSALIPRTYNIYKSTVSGSAYFLEGTESTYNSLPVTGLSSGTTYYFIVNGVGSGFESDPSLEVSATTTGISNGTTGGDSDSGLAPNEACYIATAAYGSYLDPHVQSLRNFRDDVLLKSAIGRELVELYYRTSPPVAEFIRTHEGARTLSRVALTPVVFGVAFPGLTFAMAFGMGIMGGVWMRRRRSRKAAQRYR